MPGELGGMKCRIETSSTSFQTKSKERRESASAMVFCFPSIKNTQRSMPWSIQIEVADINTELYGLEAWSELKMLKELDESV